MQSVAYKNQFEYYFTLTSSRAVKYLDEALSV